MYLRIVFIYSIAGRDYMSDNIVKKNTSTDKHIIDVKKIVLSPYVTKLLMADFLLLILTYGGFYRSIFANSDTLWGVLDPSSTFKARLDCFRWIPALFECFFNKTGLLPALNFRLSFFLFLCALCFSLLLIQIVFADLFKRIYPLKCKEPLFLVTVIFAVSLSYINVLFTEFFYFTETFYTFGLAFILMSVGFYMLSIKKYVLAVMAFFFMTMCYQMSCPIITVCIGVYVYLEHRGKFSGELVKDELIKAMPPMIFFVFNYVTGPMVQSILAMVGIESYQEKSVLAEYSLGEYICVLIPSVKELFSSSLELTPRIYMPLFVFAITFVTVFFLCLKRKSFNQLLTFLLVEVILGVLSLAVQIAENPNYFIARTSSTFYFALSMQLLIMIFFLASNDKESNCFKRIEKILYMLPVFAVLFNVFFIQCIIQNRIISETLDSIYAEKIFAKIEGYEEETGIIVNKIAPINDTDSSPFYDQVNFCRGAINRRCYSDYTWTFLQYCAYETDLAGSLTGRSFERSSMNDDIYKEFFEGKNWTSFDEDEQIVIQDDTAYICVF